MPIGQDDMSLGQSGGSKGQSLRHSSTKETDIVFDKSIFANIFYKDIRRVYIYKRAERLASALYLVAPAFRESMSLRAKVESIAVRLTEAARLPGTRLVEALSRELLALSSLLAMARSGGLLSPMNADLIGEEARALLEEVSLYEEPRLSLEQPETLSALARRLPVARRGAAGSVGAPRTPVRPTGSGEGSARPQGQSSRAESIVTYIGEKGSVTIKDLTVIVRDVSEKTIQRELQGLIEAGRVIKRGERRWSTYELS